MTGRDRHVDGLNLAALQAVLRRCEAGLRESPKVRRVFIDVWGRTFDSPPGDGNIGVVDIDVVMAGDALYAESGADLSALGYRLGRDLDALSYKVFWRPHWGHLRITFTEDRLKEGLEHMGNERWDEHTSMVMLPGAPVPDSMLGRMCWCGKHPALVRADDAPDGR